jgi:hypothetical protein
MKTAALEVLYDRGTNEMRASGMCVHGATKRASWEVLQ